MCILAGGWPPDGARPVEVHVGELVGQLLDVGRLQLGDGLAVDLGVRLGAQLAEHDEVGGGNSSLGVEILY